MVDLGVFTQGAGAVTLTAPANGAANQPLRPAFTWAAAPQAASYQLEVATDAGFANVVLGVGGIAATAFTPDADLASNTQYYWRVRATNPCGTGAYSAAFTFATVATAW